MAKAALKQVSPAPTIGALIDKMKTIAVERSTLSAKDKALSEEQKGLEQQIIELMDKQETRVGEGKIATMTHDEIVSVIPERLGQKLLDANLKIMKTPPAWAPDLPINAEAVGWATNYSI